MRLRAAAIVIIAIALAGAACSDSQGPSDSQRSDVDTVLARAEEAMSARSFSVTTCLSCEPPTTLEFAPPDRIQLSHSSGHDSWRFNLIVDGQRYISSRGEHWIEGASLESAGMPLSDPRVLLQYVIEPRFEDDDTLEGTAHYVISARLDSERMVNEVYRKVYQKNITDQDDEEGDEGFDSFLANYEEFIGGLRLRFWIDKESFVVSQLEEDSPPPTQEPGDAGEDPPPSIIAFDFETPVDIPGEPLSLPRDEAGLLDGEILEGARAIREGVEAYIDEIGSVPPAVDPEILADFLSEDWPANPYTHEPMRQSAIFTSGDFCYEPEKGDQPYGFGVYGWDGYLDGTARLCRTTGPPPNVVSETMDSVVNEVIAAIDAHDLEALVSLLRPSEVPCKADAVGLDPGPHCPSGAADGSLVEAFYSVNCEVGFIPLERAIQNFRGTYAEVFLPTSTTYAVYRLPPPSFRDEDIPSYAVLMSFELDALDERQGWILTVHGDGIVSYDSGCIRTPEKLIEDHGFTNPILGPPN